MNLGHGLRTLLGATLIASLGAGCTEQKAPSAPPPESSGNPPRQASAGLVGTPYLVRDLRTGSEHDNFFEGPSFFVALGNTVLVSASDKVHGRELWRTDGTAAGTSLVLDLLPGTRGSDPSHAVVMNGRVYFLAGATGETYYTGLWRTDGTSEGTVLVKSLRAQGTFLKERNGVLYIGTGDPTGYTSGFGLWRSDGTPDGTTPLRVESVETGTIGAHSAEWLGDTLLFSAPGAAQGMALWTTDGTREGTRLLKDPHPGFDHLMIGGLTACNGRVLFLVENFGRPYSLWRTDGTEEGTVEVMELPTSAPSGSGSQSRPPLTCMGDDVYFAAWDAQAGLELWKSDGTAAGTARVADLNPGTAGSAPKGFAVHDGSLYFAATDAAAGTELWKSDGTAQGTMPVLDVAPGADSALDEADPVTLISSPAGLFFMAREATHGVQLWKTDGTPQGTSRLSDNTSTHHGFRELKGIWAQGALHFWSRDDELWRSTGTASGTGKVTALAQHVLGSFASWREMGVGLEGTLFFSATGEEGIERLWRSNGTSAGTTPVGGATALYSPAFPILLNGRLLVVATETSGGRFLWSVDTTGQAPVKLASANLWQDGVSTRWPVAAGGQVFFISGDIAGGDTLWKTDGTVAGSRALKDFSPGQFGERHPWLLTAVGSRVFFVVGSGFNHEELWTSDGTEEGTVRVAALADSSEQVAIDHMVAMNGRLYFWAFIGARGRELWTSDGTQEGTRALGAVASPFWRTVGPASSAVVGGTLFFSISHEGAPPELWKSDGESVVKLRTFGTHETVFPPVQLTPFGSTLVFWADDGVSGYQPWRSDGTEEGTVKVKDVRAGGATAMGSTGARFTRLGEDGPLLFSASDGLTGLELWQTDGTDEGTVRVADIAPGVASSAPRWMAVAGPRVFFPAWHPASGLELWAMPLTGGDIDPPSLSCPAAQVVEAVNGQGAPVSYPPATVTDADASPTVEYSHATGSTFALGGTEVRVTATDDAGNEATCAFTVTVRDTVAPTLACPPSQSVVAETAAGVAVTWPEVQASDAVSTPTVSSVPARGSVFTPGMTDVSVTATDAAGNSRSCMFAVRVEVAGADGGTPDGGSSGPDAGPTPPPSEDSSGCGCTQSGGAGMWLAGLALLGLLSARRRQSHPRP
ncbi:ELWxxDGT repeat protein [Pyxidicoccus sp. 3LG]